MTRTNAGEGRKGGIGEEGAECPGKERVEGGRAGMMGWGGGGCERGKERQLRQGWSWQFRLCTLRGALEEEMNL